MKYMIMSGRSERKLYNMLGAIRNDNYQWRNFINNPNAFCIKLQIPICKLQGPDKNISEVWDINLNKYRNYPTIIVWPPLPGWLTAYKLWVASQSSGQRERGQYGYCMTRSPGQCSSRAGHHHPGPVWLVSPAPPLSSRKTLSVKTCETSQDFFHKMW